MAKRFHVVAILSTPEIVGVSRDLQWFVPFGVSLDSARLVIAHTAIGSAWTALMVRRRTLGFESSILEEANSLESRVPTVLRTVATGVVGAREEIDVSRAAFHAVTEFRIECADRSFEPWFVRTLSVGTFGSG